ncbi:MAG TPA: RNA methyltransferase substrate-binding domain-containing protein, partial [Acidimicrobiales bacterium]|nr:RNA methyltransferase substrate-binding domain-containing protein [Acidimicrobiales bacterium]
MSGRPPRPRPRGAPPARNRGRRRGGSQNGRERQSGLDRQVREERTGTRSRPAVRSELGGDQVEGRHAVLELLAAGRRPVLRVLLAEDQDPSPQLDRIEELAARR